MAATEAPDTAAFNGTVAAGAITGTLNAIEASDTANFNGTVTGIGVPTQPTSGGWIDYGRERRRKAKGLRQAEKFFEKVKADAEEKKRKLEVVAEQVRRVEGYRPSDEATRVAFQELQQRQQQVIDDMLAQSRARVENARLELAQAKALERARELALGNGRGGRNLRPAPVR